MANETFRILRILIERQGEGFSIRKLSKLRNINYKSAYQAIMKLENQGLVKIEKLGNTSKCSFTGKLNALTFAVEHERSQELTKNRDFKVIHSRLSQLTFPLIALLFGSYAKKKPDKHSDIDLLIVTQNQREVEQALSLIPLKIHPTIITYKDFTTMAKSREFSVVSEAMKRNIILVGIEEYYRLLENVGH